MSPFSVLGQDMITTRASRVILFSVVSVCVFVCVFVCQHAITPEPLEISPGNFQGMHPIVKTESKFENGSGCISVGVRN